MTDKKKQEDIKTRSTSGFSAFDTESDTDFVNVLITTEDYFISGKVYLPIQTVVSKPTPENLLFYTLNSGKTFLAIRDCTITTKRSLEFKPEEVSYYILNLNIVRSCKIIKD